MIRYPPHLRQALLYANKLAGEFDAVKPILQQFRIRTEKIDSAFNNVIAALKTGEVDDFLVLSLWFPGELKIFGDSILSVAETGLPLFPSIFGARQYAVEKARRENAESSFLDRQSRERAKEIMHAKVEQAEARARAELAQRLGLNSKMLDRLLRGDEERVDEQNK